MTAPLAVMDWTIVGLLALVVFTWVLLRRWHRYFKRRQTDPSPVVKVPRPDDQAASRPSYSDVSPELLKFEVQLEERARELMAQLDSKMVALMHLIRDARQCIDRLEMAQHGPTTDEATPQAPVETPPLDPELVKIHALAKQGFSAVTIAHQVERPLDEIEKILGHR